MGGGLPYLPGSDGPECDVKTNEARGRHFTRHFSRTDVHKPFSLQKNPAQSSVLIVRQHFLFTHLHTSNNS